MILNPECGNKIVLSLDCVTVRDAKRVIWGYLCGDGAMCNFEAWLVVILPD